MLTRLDGCKGCTENVRVTPEKLERLIELAIRGRETASDQDYAARMAQCQSCDALQYETTCRHCGCLVAVRARLAESACPFPTGSKWS